jgi:hypothetical protein
VHRNPIVARAIRRAWVPALLVLASPSPALAAPTHAELRETAKRVIALKGAVRVPPAFFAGSGGLTYELGIVDTGLAEDTRPRAVLLDLQVWIELLRQFRWPEAPLFDWTPTLRRADTVVSEGLLVLEALPPDAVLPPRWTRFTRARVHRILMSPLRAYARDHGLVLRRMARFAFTDLTRPITFSTAPAQGQVLRMSRLQWTIETELRGNARPLDLMTVASDGETADLRFGEYVCIGRWPDGRETPEEIREVTVAGTWPFTAPPPPVDGPP